mmetsp:Transcript_17371/g.55780  ORF Transcript_17371/g.55780 Transcript_17371/m.55780 type:complete len:113 (+) Transcript_17371:44-382(+)
MRSLHGLRTPFYAAPPWVENSLLCGPSMGCNLLPLNAPNLPSPGAAHLQIMGDLLIVCEGRLCAIAASRDTPRDCTMAILSASAEMELWALAEAAGEELSALYPELVGTHAG